VSARFYTDDALKQGDFVLTGPEAHHLAHVRRLQPGETVLLFNGDGCEYPATITAVGKRDVQLQVANGIAIGRESATRVHIGSAMPKGDRADFLIEKLTELGVTEFTPLHTARAVVQPKPAIVDKLQRAVIEASKQCGRTVLLKVHPPKTFTQWITSAELPPVKWLLHPGNELLSRSAARDVALAIGPEGGFTDDETSAAQSAGFLPRSLGPRILRIETAALAAATLLT